MVDRKDFRSGRDGLFLHQQPRAVDLQYLGDWRAWHVDCGTEDGSRGTRFARDGQKANLLILRLQVSKIGFRYCTVSYSKFDCIHCT
jgi:hypothetical protein